MISPTRSLDDRPDVRRLRVVRSLDEERWSAFVDEQPHASVFHTPEMHRVFGETRNHRPGVWAGVGEEGVVHALMTPVAIATLGGPLRSLTTRVVSFAGPLVSRGPSQPAILEALLRSYQRESPRAALFTEFRNPIDPGNLGPTLASCGFRHEAHLNFLVDLTLTEEELWERVAPSARRNIRKGRRMGVTVEEAHDLTGIAAGYGVLADVYHRIRVPLPHRSLFDAGFRILAPLGRFTMLIAQVQERTIGVLTLLRYRGVLTYWYTGTLREDAAYRAGDLLVWHAISSGRARGDRVLDFGGAGRPDQPYGVRDFKAKYGGALVEPGRDLWVSSPLRMRVTTAGYEVVRRFLR
jgi:serine/alanine adding enzyme